MSSLSGGTSRPRDLTVFLTAKTISDIGFALDFICLTVFVWVRTGSTLATGLVSLALYSGSIVGGRLGHRYGDRWDRRWMMISADLTRTVMLAILAVLPTGAQTWWLYLAVIGVGMGRSVFEASLSAATPVLAGERTQLVNSTLAGLKGAAFVIGMGLATVLVPVIGYRGVFAADASSYALSALVLLTLRLRMREAGTESAADGNAEPISWVQLVGAGLAALMILRGLDAFASSSQQVGLPVLGSKLLPSDPTGVAGAVWSCWAGGLLLASFGLRPLARGLINRAPQRVFCLATIVMSAGFIGVFWLSGWAPMLISALIAGIGDSFSEVTFKQVVQALPDSKRGRAFGFSQIVVNGGFMSGLLVTSLALRPSYLAQWVLLLHGIPLVVAAWMAATANRAVRVPEPTT